MDFFNAMQQWSSFYNCNGVNPDGKIADLGTVSLYPENIPFSKYHNITEQRHPANPTSDFKNHELMRFFFSIDMTKNVFLIFVLAIKQKKWMRKETVTSHFVFTIFINQPYVPVEITVLFS